MNAASAELLSEAVVVSESVVVAGEVSFLLHPTIAMLKNAPAIISDNYLLVFILFIFLVRLKFFVMV